MRGARRHTPAGVYAYTVTAVSNQVLCSVGFPDRSALTKATVLLLCPLVGLQPCQCRQYCCCSPPAWLA